MKSKTINILALSLALSISSISQTNAKNYNTKEIMEDDNKDELESSELEFQVLLDEYNKSGREFEEIIENEDENSILYISALYVKLREFGLDDQTIKNELYNVVTYGLVHPYPDGWKNDLLVYNLNQSLDYSEDAICYYYPLATYDHLFNCELEHEIEEGRIGCDTIIDDLMKMNEDVLPYNYLVENVLALDDYNPAKLALYKIINSNEDIISCLYELETLYKIVEEGEVSIDDSNELKHLRKTLEGDNLDSITYYYDLACIAHALLFYEVEEVEYKDPGITI